MIRRIKNDHFRQCFSNSAYGELLFKIRKRNILGSYLVGSLRCIVGINCGLKRNLVGFGLPVVPQFNVLHLSSFVSGGSFFLWGGLFRSCIFGFRNIRSLLRCTASQNGQA